MGMLTPVRRHVLRFTSRKEVPFVLPFTLGATSNCRPRSLLGLASTTNRSMRRCGSIQPCTDQGLRDRWANTLRVTNNHVFERWIRNQGFTNQLRILSGLARCQYPVCWSQLDGRSGVQSIFTELTLICLTILKWLTLSNVYVFKSEQPASWFSGNCAVFGRRNRTGAIRF